MKHRLMVWWHHLFHQKYEIWYLKAIHDADKDFFVSYHKVRCCRCGYEYLAKRAWLKFFHPTIQQARKCAEKTNQWS